MFSRSCSSFIKKKLFYLSISVAVVCVQVAVNVPIAVAMVLTQGISMNALGSLTLINYSLLIYFFWGGMGSNLTMSFVCPTYRSKLTFFYLELKI